MTTLLVRGLDDEAGPGDIVGAFVNETDADPDDIGDIDVDGDEATVDVVDDAADDVASAMDGGRVGSSEVRVHERDDAVHEYVEHYSELVELEREAEMERHEGEIRSLSGRERESKGRALVRMAGRDEGEGLGGHLVKFLKADSSELPDTELSVGDLAMVSKSDPLRDDNPTGTVTQVTNHSVTVAFDREPDGWVFDDGVRLDLYVNDVTFQRMLDALDDLEAASGALADLRDVFVGEREPDDPEREDVEFFDDDLNDAQRRAVERSLGTEDVHLVHGPPGTGKTTTAVEVIRQAVDGGESVLATAASNTAVDNLVEFLVERGVDVVRVGHPARVTPALREHTLDNRVEDVDAYRRAEEKREEAFDLMDEQEDLTTPSGKWRRGLSDDRIRELAEQGEGSRGVPAEKIEEMAEFLELDERIDEAFDEADRLEDEAIAAVVEDADVVCTTNSTAGSDLLDGFTFDRLVLDEATQATEPSCLIPATRAERVVLAGDHRQLPPTVQSREAADRGLRETLFERLADHDHARSRLVVQYRMHETIMDYASEQFYEDGLEAADPVADHTLADLDVTPGDAALASDDARADAESAPDVENPELASGVTLDTDAWSRVLAPDRPLALVDTSEADAREESREGSPSRENPVEADVVAQAVDDLVRGGLDPADVAVISPYDDQVSRLSGMLDHDALEVDTVDGFQGREKEAVVVSLVRSNSENEIGFLTETRRFNVAATRARRKLLVVGDADTLSTVDAFAAFADHADRRGIHETA